MEKSLFQGRFARRMLLLFVGCALAPVCVLALLVSTHTRAQLEDQSRARLHQGSKAVGLAILERLTLLEEEARLAAERFSPAEGAASVSPGARAHFSALAVAGSDGAVTPVFGPALLPPTLASDLERRLDEGAPVLAREAGRLLLVVPLGDAPEGRRVLAVLEPGAVVAPASIRTEGDPSQYCVLAADGAPIACSFEADAGLLATLHGEGSAPLGFEYGGEAYLAHRWSLFLKARFGAAPWNVVLAEPHGMVMGPLAAFERSVALVVVGSMLCVLLLSISQIRRSLVPLQRLRAGARRIARNEFDARVETGDRDEFQEVADAFNGMAETLGRQFQALITIDEIDRAVLSSVESIDIVETVLAGMGDVQPCDAVGFLLLDAAHADRGTLRVRIDGSAEADAETPVALEPADLDALVRTSRVLTLELRSGLPGWLQPLAERSMGLFQVLPVVVEGRPRGALVVAHTDAPSLVAPAPTHARQIADQVAVALANADMIREIRELNRTLEDKVRERTAELSAAMEELRETQAQLVHREKMASVGQLVAGVAHEINNPLNFIHGNVKFLESHRQALAKAVDDYEAVLAAGATDPAAATSAIRERHDLDFVVEDLAAIVEAVREGVERTTEIVSNLQSFSRIDGGDHRPVDLHELLDSTVSILSSRLTGLEVVREYGDVPAVECLAGQISQVFMNLIVNAADAAGEGGHITLRTAPAGADTVRVEIEDDGCGIPPEARDRIFDPFFTTKDVGKGTGLGLAITFGVIARHGGRIGLESEVGRGTCFRIELPIKFRPGASDELEGAPVPPEGAGA